MTTSQKQALFQRDPTHDYPVIERGEGIYLYDTDGRRYIDGAAGASNVILGHGRTDIAQAMADQAATLAYCFSAYFTNQPALDLAARIAALAPGDLNNSYFVSGGSEGIETAIKIARQYHLQRGNQQKHQVIARWRSYHGATLGALSLTGMPWLRKAFSPMLLDFPHIAPCYPYRCSFAGCEGQCNLKCADELEQAIIQAGPENVSAFVAEPVVMAGIGCGVPPADYFPRVREICDKYDVLFIADEIITGFGRTGRYFAIEHWDAVPDMIVFGKGASSGYYPLGGVVLSDAVRAPFEADGAFFAHIFTYVNNPVAMRVCLEVLDIFEREDILAHTVEMGHHMEKRAQELYAHPSVGEVRCKGMIMGVELVRDKKTKEPFPAELGFGKYLNKTLLARGLSTGLAAGVADWVNGEDLRFHPPLIITREQLDEVLDIIDEGLTETETALMG
jgi:adenosylmethionine-8-amino-7-oxononanoate aminotransferase